MKNVHTTIAKTPVRVSAKAATQVIRPKRVKKIHPAEAAGMVVHQAVENGVVAVKDTVVGVFTYATSFAKGLVKGH